MLKIHKTNVENTQNKMKLYKQKADRNKKRQTNLNYNWTLQHSSCSNQQKQKISKDIKDINDTINQFYLIDMYRALYPTTKEYTSC